MVSFASLFLSAQPAVAQDLPLPALSPRAEVMQTVGVVEVRVTYSSPGKRERTIWGELVPYGELWRTGANAATTLEIDGPITFGETEVAAGKYALFTIPGEEKWTVILNSNADQGGTGSYDEELDVARYEVAPLPGAQRERLTFLFADTTEDSSVLNLVWDGVRVPMAIGVDTNGMVSESATAFAERSAGRLTRAARYFMGTDDDRAMALVESALAIDENWYAMFTKAEILKSQGRRGPAKRAARKAKALGDAAEGFFWKERVEKAIAEW